MLNREATNNNFIVFGWTGLEPTFYHTWGYGRGSNPRSITLEAMDGARTHVLSHSRLWMGLEPTFYRTRC